MRYEIMTEMNVWLESNRDEIIELRSFFPELAIRVIDDNGEDVTAEFIKTTRCILIYG